MLQNGPLQPQQGHAHDHSEVTRADEGSKETVGASVAYVSVAVYQLHAGPRLVHRVEKLSYAQLALRVSKQRYSAFIVIDNLLLGRSET